MITKVKCKLCGRDLTPAVEILVEKQKLSTLDEILTIHWMAHNRTNIYDNFEIKEEEINGSN